MVLPKNTLGASARSRAATPGLKRMEKIVISRRVTGHRPRHWRRRRLRADVTRPALNNGNEIPAASDRDTPRELVAIEENFQFDGSALADANRLVGKVGSAARVCHPYRFSLR
jgi:hypothetical protein